MKSTDIIFQTDRLVIRQFKESDFEYIHEYAKNPIVSQFQVWGPNSEEETRTFIWDAIRNIDDKPRFTYQLCVELEAIGKPIGGCGVFIDSDDLHQAQIGYAFNPRFWNQGFATEATKGLINYALKELGIKIIKATCEDENRASKRVLEKSGFKLEKFIKDDFFQKGKMRNTLLFKLETEAIFK